MFYEFSFLHDVFSDSIENLGVCCVMTFFVLGICLRLNSHGKKIFSTKFQQLLEKSEDIHKKRAKKIWLALNLSYSYSPLPPNFIAFDMFTYPLIIDYQCFLSPMQSKLSASINNFRQIEYDKFEENDSNSVWIASYDTKKNKSILSKLCLFIDASDI